MTATDPRPQLAAMLAEKLAPAVETLAAAYAEDIDAGPPPPDDRALAERHRAGRAQLSHLRQLLGVLDWAAARMPEPAEEPACETGEPRNEPRDEPRPYVSDYDGSEDEFHYGGEVYVGSQETPEFKAWLAEVERRAGPVPKDPDHPDRPVSCTFDERQFIGDLNSPEYREWRDRHQRRVTEELERLLNGDDDDDDADGAPQAQPITPPAPPERYAPTPPHDKT